MSVTEGVTYKHYKGDFYKLIAIAQPISHMPQTTEFGRTRAFHTEIEEEIDIFKVDNTVYSEKLEFLVIYKNVNEPKIFARPLDMFFGYVLDENCFVPRFLLQKGD